MSMADKMMEFMMGEMSKEDKEEMMDKFFADMTADDKRKMMAQMMEQMMPKMMDAMSVMMGMMSRMKGSGEKMEMPMMHQMMMEMMPKCLTMMLPDLPKEERIDFVAKMVATLVEQGSVGMSGEEEKSFRAKLAERIGS